MLQIPDINPALKGGIITTLLFIVFGLIGIIAWFLKNQVAPGAPRVITREPSSGEKPPEYWERVFEDIETEGNKALLAVLTEHHRSVMEMLGKLRARLRESDQAVTSQIVKDFRAKYDQDMIAIAKMLRAIEERI